MESEMGKKVNDPGEGLLNCTACGRKGKNSRTEQTCARQNVQCHSMPQPERSKLNQAKNLPKDDSTEKPQFHPILVLLAPGPVCRDPPCAGSKSMSDTRTWFCNPQHLEVPLQHHHDLARTRPVTVLRPPHDFETDQCFWDTDLQCQCQNPLFHIKHVKTPGTKLQCDIMLQQWFGQNLIGTIDTWWKYWIISVVFPLVQWLFWSPVQLTSVVQQGPGCYLRFPDFPTEMWFHRRCETVIFGSLWAGSQWKQAAVCYQSKIWWHLHLRYHRFHGLQKTQTQVQHRWFHSAVWLALGVGHHSWEDAVSWIPSGIYPHLDYPHYPFFGGLSLSKLGIASETQTNCKRESSKVVSWISWINGSCMNSMRSSLGSPVRETASAVMAAEVLGVPVEEALQFLSGHPARQWPLLPQWWPKPFPRPFCDDPCFDLPFPPPIGQKPRFLKRSDNRRPASLYDVKAEARFSSDCKVSAAADS